MRKLTSMGEKTVKRIVLFLTIAMFVGVIVASFFLLDAMPQSSGFLSKLLSVVMVLALLLLSAAILMVLIIVLHEIGHLIAGRAEGFLPILIQFLFLQWRKEGDALRFRFAWDIRKWNGMAGRVAMIPPPDVTTDQMVKHILGGVRINVHTGLAAFLIALILVLVGVSPLRTIILLLAGFGYLSLLLGLTNLYDLRSQGIYSDGDMARLLLAGNADSEAFLATQRAAGAMYTGAAPKAFTSHVDREDLHDPLTIAMYNLLAYQRALDARDWDAAIREIDAIRPDHMHLMNVDTAELAVLALLHDTLVQPDLEQAEQDAEMLAEHRKDGVSMADWTALAHFSHCKGDDEEALQRIDKALAAEAQEADAGSAAMYRALLEELQAKIVVGTRRDITGARVGLRG